MIRSLFMYETKRNYYNEFKFHFYNEVYIDLYYQNCQLKLINSKS